MSQLTEPQVPVRMHRVKYEITYTHNLGNFESSKIAVGLEQDGFGHPDATFGKVREWVEANLEVAVKDVIGALKGE